MHLCLYDLLLATQNLRRVRNVFILYPSCLMFLWYSIIKAHAIAVYHHLWAQETNETNNARLCFQWFQAIIHSLVCRIYHQLNQAGKSCSCVSCSVRCQRALATRMSQVQCLFPHKYLLHTTNNLPPAWRSMHYPPETSSIMLMARMVAVVKQAKNKAHWQKLFAHFCSRAANEEEEIAHKLLGEQFRGQLALLHSLFKAALYDDHLNRWFVPEGFRSLFALVGTNGQGIGTSSLSRWVHACDALELPAQQREQLDSFIDQLYKDIEKETGDFLNCEGSGLFLLQSSCNHSCIPNAEASFPDNNFLLQLSALSDINPGEEICISYLDCCQRDRSRHSRHKILRENYLFVCSCPKCVSQMDELDVTSEEEEEEEGEAEGETEGDEMEDEMTDV
ncbi:SET and MYND domain-containing protein 5 [Collichthys lucidus]|uniref:Protein-lysine N-trimethyltransferase SMYD5 n=1 Tax=Collichthys lucidus TaxID=240159 RepID=A0A4U5UDP6_COLLU|nr:SET and MYND domain-containing protein 5 [Collichthys lucidus]